MIRSLCARLILMPAAICIPCTRTVDFYSHRAGRRDSERRHQLFSWVGWPPAHVQCSGWAPPHRCQFLSFVCVCVSRISFEAFDASLLSPLRTYYSTFFPSHHTGRHNAATASDSTTCDIVRANRLVAACASLAGSCRSGAPRLHRDQPFFLSHPAGNSRRRCHHRCQEHRRAHRSVTACTVLADSYSDGAPASWHEGSSCRNRAPLHRSLA